MKKLLLFILSLAFCAAVFAQPGQPVPGGSISNPRGYFDSIGPRTPAGVTPVKQDTVLHIAPFKIWNTNDTIYSIPDTVPIYSEMAAKFDSASISNDTVYFYRDNSTPLKIKLSGLTDTSTLQAVLTKGNAATLGFTTTGAVGIGTATVNSSAILTLSSTTKGFLIPKMTQAQKHAIANPEIGLQVFDTDRTTGNQNYIFTGNNYFGQ